MTGWAVEVRFQYMDGGWTPPQIWYVLGIPFIAPVSGSR